VTSRLKNEIRSSANPLDGLSLILTAGTIAELLSSAGSNAANLVEVLLQGFVMESTSFTHFLDDVEFIQQEQQRQSTYTVSYRVIREECESITVTIPNFEGGLPRRFTFMGWVPHDEGWFVSTQGQLFGRLARAQAVALNEGVAQFISQYGNRVRKANRFWQ
jgi:hypothetical protein